MRVVHPENTKINECEKYRMSKKPKHFIKIHKVSKGVIA